MQPVVSVLMPTFNGEKYIGEAIASVLNQTYHNFELIIVDDGSQDDTCKIVREFRDRRIKLIENKENKGIAMATNTALSAAFGKYIALLDHDDIALENRLELQVAYLEDHHDIDILGARTIFVDSNGHRLRYGGETRKNPKYIKAMLLFNSVDFMNSTVMMRKSFVQNNSLFYKEGCYGMQDFLFFIEASKIGKMSSLDEFLAEHRYYGGNATNHYMENHMEERKKKYAEFQRYSLEKSGFVLKEEEQKLINKVFAETNGGCDTIEELTELYNVLVSLIIQGQNMKIDFLDEFEYVCKKKLVDQLMRFECLNWRKI